MGGTGRALLVPVAVLNVDAAEGEFGRDELDSISYVGTGFLGGSGSLCLTGRRRFKIEAAAGNGSVDVAPGDDPGKFGGDGGGEC